MLSEKYLAGLLDSDGAFGVRFFRRAEGDFRPAAYMEISQAPRNDLVLHLLKEQFGGTVSYRNGTTGYGAENAASWCASHTLAKKLMARVEKYLVVRRPRVRLYLKYLEENPRVSAEMLPLHQAQLRDIRQICGEVPNYPSRAWLAGYFDGDGCFASRISKAGYAYLSLRITEHISANTGLLLLQKAFGGEIYYHCGEHLPTWVLHLPPSKAIQVVGHFAKHMIVKRAQAYYVLGCAKGGNYRDGHTIHADLRQLKAQGQRLNDGAVDVSPMLAKVRFDVPDGRGAHMKQKR
jgi:hypothetical protein